MVELLFIYEANNTLILPQQFSISNSSINNKEKEKEKEIMTGISIKRIKSLNDDINTYFKESTTDYTKNEKDDKSILKVQIRKTRMNMT